MSTTEVKKRGRKPNAEKKEIKTNHVPIPDNDIDDLAYTAEITKQDKIIGYFNELNPSEKADIALLLHANAIKVNKEEYEVSAVNLKRLSDTHHQ